MATEFQPVLLPPVASRAEATRLRAEARRQFASARDAGTPWSDEVVAATRKALAEIDAEAEASEERQRLARKTSDWRQRRQHDDEYVAACQRREREIRQAVAA